MQYTQELTRGPSAGGSGQDNVYSFDGVNVTVPLFGTLSAEPASHDIAQVTVIRGGAKAVDFDRAGGFAMDSVSRSGTSAFHGQVNFQLQTAGMASDLDSGVLSKYEQDRSWLDANLGGPIVKDRAYFYGSYYRPEKSRDNRANLYGELPQYNSTRNEGFGKLTLTPTHSILLNFSYRDSKRVDVSDLFQANTAGTAGSGNEARLKIGTADGSWVINSRSYLNFKYTHFTNRTQGRPDNIADVAISTAVGTRLDIGALDRQGLLTVPVPVSGNTAYNNFVQPLIDRYGYDQNGVKTGGGNVGFGLQFDNDDFFRDSGQIGYNLTVGARVVHDLHFGYQRYTDSEDLTRSSNGWGLLTVPGGRLSFQGRPIFYEATFQQQTTGAVPTIHSEYQSQSFEFNDTIKLADWTFNLGVLASNDTLYGQGLREDSSVLSGYTLAPGNKYKMYEIPFKKLIQPRLGATWAYDLKGTAYASYARYNSAASSLPRAASWDRNIAASINAYFDQNGILFATDPVAASSGKLFDDDLTPRRVDEFVLGTSRQLSEHWSGRLYGRYRRGSHFWEDTNNDARLLFNPPADIPRELYIPDLTAQREPDRQRIDLRHRRARRRLLEVLRGDGGDGMARCQDHGQRLVHLEPLLRELRPGQLHDRQRPQHLHRLQQHRGRRGAAALGLQGRDAPRRPAAPPEAVWDAVFPLAARARARSSSPSPASPGSSGTSSPIAPSPPRPARRTATPRKRAHAARTRTGSSTSTTRRTSSWASGSTCSSRATSSTSSTSRRATASSRGSTTPCSGRRGSTSTRGGCRWRRECSSSGPRTDVPARSAAA